MTFVGLAPDVEGIDWKDLAPGAFCLAASRKAARIQPAVAIYTAAASSGGVPWGLLFFTPTPYLECLNGPRSVLAVRAAWRCRANDFGGWQARAGIYPDAGFLAVAGNMFLVSVDVESTHFFERQTATIDLVTACPAQSAPGGAPSFLLSSWSVQVEVQAGDWQTVAEIVAPTLPP